MNITSFIVSQDKSNLVLSISDASAATTLYLWTHKTYKVEGLEIDLSSKLNGSTTQVINITPEELDLSYFDGVYFIELGDGVTDVCANAAELTKYKECILTKVLAQKNCVDCLSIYDSEVLQAQTLLYTLGLALKEKLPQEIIVLLFGLDKFCSNDCNGCGKYTIK